MTDSACTRPNARYDRGYAVEDRNLIISAEDLHSNLDDPDLRILDCRFELMRPEAGQASYLQAHIPGAIYADLDRDLSAPVTADSGRHPLPKAAVMGEAFGRMGISANTHVVVYDDGSGAVAARTWWLLRWLGHNRASLLDGGIARWRLLGLALEEGKFSVAPRIFVGSPREELVLETQAICEAGETCADLQLVDARDTSRFIGESEPIDAVAGHIPGSINLPFAASLRDDGTWKCTDDLRRLWDKTLGDPRDSPWSVMCGSGVTACHLAVSGLLAGLPEPRLYVGSWSEWIRDPARAVATGTA